MTQHWRNPSGQIIRSGGSVVRCPSCPCDEPLPQKCCSDAMASYWSIIFNGFETNDFSALNAANATYAACLVGELNANTFVPTYVGEENGAFGAPNYLVYRSLVPNCSGSVSGIVWKPYIELWVCANTAQQIPWVYIMSVQVRHYDSDAYPAGPPFPYSIPLPASNWTKTWSYSMGTSAAPEPCLTFDKTTGYANEGTVRVVGNL